MKRVLGTIGLALGLAISVIPGYAQSFQEFRSEQTTIAPPRVMDSWMQPTYVRTTQMTDQNGDSHVREEPLIMERHERVMIPQVKSETVTLVQQQPEVTVRRTKFATRVATTGSARSCVSHRRLRRTFASAPRPRSIAYRSNAQNLSTTTSSSKMIQQSEHTEDQSVIMERRDPALDLY